jgi:ribosome biogenesis GTPase
MIPLETYGWNTSWKGIWQQQLGDFTYVPARVIVDHGTRYKIATAEGIMDAALAGSLAHKLPAFAMPKIGDWVAIELSSAHQATIQVVLPRATEIVRGQVGRRHDKQVVAANVDIAFIVQPLDHDFSPERLERYLFQLGAQHIEVVVLLNKADAVTDATEKQAELENLNVETIIMSAVHDADVAAVERRIPTGKTAVFIGSSGAGKSTLTNRLLGEDRQATAAIREKDSKGRHTTVHRELFVLPSGGMVIDTPGIRELQLWGSYEDLEQSFPEITTAIRSCHFPHCTHTNETGCAIKVGLADGTINPVRYKRFQNFKAELEQLEKKRGFINDRKEAKTHESTKRRHAHKQRADKERYDSWE